MPGTGLRYGFKFRRWRSRLTARDDFVVMLKVPTFPCGCPQPSLSPRPLGSPINEVVPGENGLVRSVWPNAGDVPIPVVQDRDSALHSGPREPNARRLHRRVTITKCDELPAIADRPFLRVRFWEPWRLGACGLSGRQTQRQCRQHRDDQQELLRTLHSFTMLVAIVAPAPLERSGARHRSRGTRPVQGGLYFRPARAGFPGRCSATNRRDTA